MDILKYKNSYSVEALEAGSIEYPRFTLDNGTKTISVLAEYSKGTENGVLTFRRRGKNYILRSHIVPTVELEDWEMDFYVETIQSEVQLASFATFNSKPLPTLEDFYGPSFDNVGRHLEVRYLGYDMGAAEEFAPDGVSVPNSMDTEQVIADAQNPDGCVDYDPTTKTLTFVSGSYGRKHYKLIYHKEVIQ